MKISKQIIFYLALILFSACEAELDNPDTSGLFIKLLGTATDNRASELILNDEDSYVIVGGNSSSSIIQSQVSLINIDDQGDIIWQQSFEQGVGVSVKKLSEGGFIVLAQQAESNNLSSRDFLLIRTNELGEVIWTQTFGQTDIDEEAISVDVIENEGYILMGNIKGDNNTSQMWIVRTDFDGNQIFEKSYGFSNRENEIKNMLVLDNSDIVSCGTVSQGSENTDIRVVLANARGVVKWDKIIQVPGNQRGEDIKVIGNNFIIAGSTDNETNGGEDIFFARISNLGNIEVTSIIGTEVDEQALAVAIIPDGFILLGAIQNMDDEVNTDIYLVKTDFNGNEQWNKTFGGNDDDEGISAIYTNNGQYALLSKIHFENNDMMGFIKVNDNGELVE